MSYQATAVPFSMSGLRSWLATQLRLIAAELAGPKAGIITLEPRGVEPERPANGMIVYADGSAWNPGSGAGFYYRESGAWVKF